MTQFNGVLPIFPSWEKYALEYLERSKDRSYYNRIKMYLNYTAEQTARVLVNDWDIATAYRNDITPLAFKAAENFRRSGREKRAAEGNYVLYNDGHDDCRDAGFLRGKAGFSDEPTTTVKFTVSYVDSETRERLDRWTAARWPTS